MSEPASHPRQATPSATVRADRFNAAARLLIILATAGFVVFFAMWSAIAVPVMHLDGAFQTASGLYRLNAGQLPGRDFFPYLGIGPLLFLFPLFKLLGANLCASVMAAQLLTGCVGILFLSCICYLSRNRVSVVPAVAAGCIAYIFLAVVLRYTVPVWEGPFQVFAFPGNSLKPIRSSAPYLIFLGYWLISSRVPAYGARMALLGALAGIFLLWSNDFAIPSVGLFFLFLVFAAHPRDRMTWKGFPVFAAVALVLWFVLLNLITQGHPLKMLAYNFNDVARDQWWYFNSYAEYRRVFGVAEMRRVVGKVNIVSVATGAVIGYFVWRDRAFRQIVLLWIGCMLFAGGVLASVGGHFDDYFIPFNFWGYAVIFFSVCNALRAWMRRRMVARAFASARRGILGASACAAVALFCFFGFQYRADLDYARSEAGRMFHVEELGGYLGIEWKDYVKSAREAGDRVVIEEYWGIWSAVAGRFPPWPVDSVIHALGATRALASRAVGTAEVVVTSRARPQPDFAAPRMYVDRRKYRTMEIEWQPWNVSQNFWLYDQLLAGWEPYAGGPLTVVWRKRRSPLAGVPVECSVDAARPGYTIDFPAAGFYRVRLDYSLVRSGRHLLMVQNNISYAGDAYGFISVDPDGSTVDFPVYAARPGPFTFEMKVVGKARSTLTPERCTSASIPIPADAALAALYADTLAKPAMTTTRGVVSKL